MIIFKFIRKNSNKHSKIRDFFFKGKRAKKYVTDNMHIQKGVDILKEQTNIKTLIKFLYSNANTGIKLYQTDMAKSPPLPQCIPKGQTVLNICPLLYTIHSVLKKTRQWKKLNPFLLLPQILIKHQWLW